MRRQYAPRPRGRLPSEPFARTTVRIEGEDQIAMFELICAREMRRPHQVAAALVADAIAAAWEDPRMAAACVAMAASRAAYQADRAEREARPRRRGLRLVPGGRP